MMDKRDVDKLLDKLIGHTVGTGAVTSVYRDKKSFVYVGLGKDADEMWSLWNVITKMKRDIKALRAQADKLQAKGFGSIDDTIDAKIMRESADDLEQKRTWLINGPEGLV